MHKGWGADKTKEPRIVAQRLAFGRWVCRSWNGAHPKSTGRELVTWHLTYVFLDNHNPVPLGADGLVHLRESMRITVWKHHCFPHDDAPLLTPANVSHASR